MNTKQTIPIKRCIALATSIIFLFSNLQTFPSLAFSDEPPASDLTRKFFTPQALPHLVSEVSQNLFWGSIEKIHAGQIDKKIIYIQDAHDSLEAQQNIARIINHLVEHHGVKTVFEEGYEGKVPTDKYFSFINNPIIKEKVSYFLMDHLRLGGAEYAHINRIKDFNLVGVDSLKLYQQNLEQYRLSASKKEAITKDLKTIEKELILLGDRRFPSKFRQWLQIKDRFETKHLDLLTYLERTIPLLGEHSTEKQIGLSQLLHQAMKTQDPNVIEKSKSIDAYEIFESLIQLEETLAKIYLHHPADKKLFEYYKTLRLLKRLNDVQMSRTEFKTIEANLKTFDTDSFARFIFSQSPKTLILSRDWEKHIKDAIRFYEIANTRDHKMEKYLDAFIKNTNEKTAVLIFGGFHKENIKEILESKGIAYEMISPRISQTSPRHEEIYQHLMIKRRLSYELPANLRLATRPESRLLIWDANPGLAAAELGLMVSVAKQIPKADFPAFSFAVIQAEKNFFKRNHDAMQAFTQNNPVIFDQHFLGHRETVPREVPETVPQTVPVEPRRIPVPKPAPTEPEKKPSPLPKKPVPVEPEKVPARLVRDTKVFGHDPLHVTDFWHHAVMAEKDFILPTRLSAQFVIEHDGGEHARLLYERWKDTLHDLSTNPYVQSRPELLHELSEVHKVFQHSPPRSEMRTEEWQLIQRDFPDTYLDILRFVIGKNDIVETDIHSVSVKHKPTVRYGATRYSFKMADKEYVFYCKSYPSLEVIEITKLLYKNDLTGKVEIFPKNRFVLLPVPGKVVDIWDEEKLEALGRALKEMHDLNIVHRDITFPEKLDDDYGEMYFPFKNWHIFWDAQAKRIRFIDFEMSRQKVSDEQKKAEMHNILMAATHPTHALHYQYYPFLTEADKSAMSSLEAMGYHVVRAAILRGYEEQKNSIPELRSELRSEVRTWASNVLDWSDEAVQAMLKQEAITLLSRDRSFATAVGLVVANCARENGLPINATQFPDGKTVEYYGLARLLFLTKFKENKEKYKMPSVFYLHVLASLFFHLQQEYVGPKLSQDAEQRLIQLFRHHQIRHVLEVGASGNSPFALMLNDVLKKSQSDSTFTLIDLHVSGKEQAELNGIKLIEGDARNLDQIAPGQTFDLILSNGVLSKGGISSLATQDDHGFVHFQNAFDLCKSLVGSLSDLPKAALISNGLRTHLLLRRIEVESVGEVHLWDNAIGRHPYYDEWVTGAYGLNRLANPKRQISMRERRNYLDLMTHGANAIIVSKRKTQEPHISISLSRNELRSQSPGITLRSFLARISGGPIGVALKTAAPPMVNEQLQLGTQEADTIAELLGFYQGAMDQTFGYGEYNFRTKFDPLVLWDKYHATKKLTQRLGAQHIISKLLADQEAAFSQKIHQTLPKPGRYEDDDDEYENLMFSQYYANAAYRKALEDPEHFVLWFRIQEICGFSHGLMDADAAFQNAVASGMDFASFIDTRFRPAVRHAVRQYAQMQLADTDRKLPTDFIEEQTGIYMESLNKRRVVSLESQVRSYAQALKRKLMNDLLRKAQKKLETKFGPFQDIKCGLDATLRKYDYRLMNSFKEDLLKSRQDQEYAFKERRMQQWFAQMKAEGNEIPYAKRTRMLAHLARMRDKNKILSFDVDNYLKKQSKPIGRSKMIKGLLNSPKGALQYLSEILSRSAEKHDVNLTLYATAKGDLVLIRWDNFEESWRHPPYFDQREMRFLDLSRLKPPARDDYPGIIKYKIQIPAGMAANAIQFRLQQIDWYCLEPVMGRPDTFKVKLDWKVYALPPFNLNHLRHNNEKRSEIRLEIKTEEHSTKTLKEISVPQPNIITFESQKILRLRQSVVIIVEPSNIDNLPRGMFKELLELAGLNQGKLHLVIPDAPQGKYSERVSELKKVASVYYGFPQIAYSEKVPVIGFSDMEHDTLTAFQKRLDTRLAHRMKDSAFGLNQAGSFGVGLLYALKDIPAEELIRNQNGFRYDQRGWYSAQVLEVLKAYIVVSASA